VTSHPRCITGGLAWAQRVGWLRTLQISKRCMRERSALLSRSAMASIIHSAGGRRDAAVGAGSCWAAALQRDTHTHVHDDGVRMQAPESVGLAEHSGYKHSMLGTSVHADAYYPAVRPTSWHHAVAWQP